MSLASKIFEQTSFSIIQNVQKIVFVTLANIIVINALPREEYGIIGLVTGYFVFIHFLSLSPESILAQKYREIKSNDPKKYVSMLYTFFLVRTLGLVLISFIFAPFLWQITDSMIVAVVIVVYTAVQMLILMSGSLQYILKMEFQQKKITSWTFLIKLIEVILLLALFITPNILLYLGILGVTAFLEVVLWTALLRRVQSFSLWYRWRDTWREMKKNISEFSLWQHLINNLTKYMYEIDTVFLSLVASLTVVGNYAISLKIVNFGFVLPSILQLSLILTLSRLSNAERIARATSLFLKYSIFVSLIQLGAFILLGKWYILLHTRTYVDEVFLYAIIIFIAVTILNMARPLISYIVSQTNIKRFFFKSVLPAAVVTTIFYPLGAIYYGPVGIAVANIICYTFWVLTMIVYVRHEKPFRFQWIWLDGKEKELLNKFIQYINRN